MEIFITKDEMHTALQQYVERKLDNPKFKAAGSSISFKDGVINKVSVKIVERK